MLQSLTATRARCVGVAGGLVATPWWVVAELAGQVRTVSSRPDQASAVVGLCLVALSVTALWAWLQALAGVLDAWRGTGPGSGALVRRLALVACGAALGGALVGPAQARPALRPGSSDPVDPGVLTGLPLPERAEGAARLPSRRAVVVRAGDSLWALAARSLGDRPTDRSTDRSTDRAITECWHRLYALNRAVIGPDPGLIRPGQVLRLTKEQP